MKYYLNFILVLLPLLLFSQNSKKEIAYYNWFDQILGQNHTDLYNGKQYFDKDKSVLFDGRHVYFKSDKFLKGSVIYDNQPYYDLDMQYNLEIDDLIVNLKSDKSASVFKLIKDKVSEFTIDGHRFIKMDRYGIDNKLIKGFHEVLLQNSYLILLKKYRKTRRKKVKQLDRRRHLFFYFIGDYEYGILINNKYHLLNSKSDVVKLFPEAKKDINNFYYDNWGLKKAQPDAFMRSLFENVINPSLSHKESY